VSGFIFDRRKDRGVVCVFSIFNAGGSVCGCMCVYTHTHTHTAQMGYLDVSPGVGMRLPAKTQKTENSNLHGSEGHRPSSKSTKSLIQVIKAIINHLEGPKKPDGLNVGINIFVYVYKVHMCMYMLRGGMRPWTNSFFLEHIFPCDKEKQKM